MWPRGTKAKSCPWARRFQGSFRSCCGSASLLRDGSSDSCNSQLEGQFELASRFMVADRLPHAASALPKHNLSRATVTASPMRGVTLSEPEGRGALFHESLSGSGIAFLK